MFQTEPWRLGRDGERAIKAWLRENGCGVIELSDIMSGGAPPMKLDGSEVILPDFQIASNGVSRYAEVKTRSTYTEYRKTRTAEQSISLRHWEAYKAIEIVSGLTVCLCFLQIDCARVMRGTSSIEMALTLDLAS